VALLLTSLVCLEASGAGAHLIGAHANAADGHRHHGEPGLAIEVGEAPPGCGSEPLFIAAGSTRPPDVRGFAHAVSFTLLALVGTTFDFPFRAGPPPPEAGPPSFPLRI
jgi:hypothetical protein